MLHKALLSSPKEFRVSIGTQTYCTASVNKPSAMPGDLVTVTVRSNTGYGNVKVGVSPSTRYLHVPLAKNDPRTALARSLGLIFSVILGGLPHA